jgi:hypothetical protein
MSTEACTCFDDILNRAKVTFREQIQAEVSEFNVKWMGYSYFLSGDYCPVNPELEITYRELKRCGEPKVNLTKKKVAITCSYCPMCGRELAKNGGEA